MSERVFYLPTDDRQRLAVYVGDPTEGIPLVDIADEECTSPTCRETVTPATAVTRVCVSREQAAWLRDVLIALDLGPALEPVERTPEDDKPFFILSTKWSRQSDDLLWWGANRAGYTSVIAAEEPRFRTAGRYTADEVRRICGHTCGAEPVLAKDAFAMSYRAVPADSEKVRRLTEAARTALHGKSTEAP